MDPLPKELKLAPRLAHLLRHNPQTRAKFERSPLEIALIVRGRLEEWTDEQVANGAFDAAFPHIDSGDPTDTPQTATVHPAGGHGTASNATSQTLEGDLASTETV